MANTVLPRLGVVAFASVMAGWTSPTLPAGEYVVTFVPPTPDSCIGSYAFGPLRNNSSQYQWWVVLNRQ